MRVLLLDAPQSMLDERSQLGLDGRDEMWDGVLHVVPPAGGPHQRFSTAFVMVVGPVAQRRGLVPLMETGLFRAADDYRVPDQLYCLPEHFSERGAERAEAVVEFRSLGDETYQKLDFYASLGVREVLVLHPPDRRVELYRLVGERLLPVTPDAEGAHRSEVLGVTLRPDGGRLLISWDGGSAEI